MLTETTITTTTPPPIDPEVQSVMERMFCGAQPADATRNRVAAEKIVRQRLHNEARLEREANRHDAADALLARAATLCLEQFVTEVVTRDVTP